MITLAAMVVGSAAISVGVWLVAGLGVALIVAGVLAIVLGLLFAEAGE